MKPSILTVLAASTALAALGADISWTGSGNDLLWTNPANWGGVVPGVNDTALLDAGTKAQPVTLAAAEDETLVSVQIGNAENMVGALSVAGKLTATAEGSAPFIVGKSGTGFLDISGGCVTNISTARYTRDTIAQEEGSQGTVTIDNNGALYFFNLNVGHSGQGALVLNSGTFAATTTGSDGNGDLRLGETAAGEGIVIINGGSVSARTTHIGVAGSGTMEVKGGTVGITRWTRLGVSAGSQGTLLVDGGTITGIGSNDSQFGGSGTGAVVIRSGVVNSGQRDIPFGVSSTGVGTLTIEENGRWVGTNTSPIFGSQGYGALMLRGGVYEKAGSSSATMTIRGNAAGTGVLRGWGSISSSKNFRIKNNGLVIADGEGEARNLSITATGGGNAFYNDIANNSTNGWYAVNGGKLSVSMRADLAAGDSGVFTWGDVNDNAQIDMVNSARITFSNITGKNGFQSIRGSVFANDRTDAHLEDLPAAATKVGSWQFANLTSNSACASFDLELRYDHVAAQGLALTLWRYVGAAWEAIPDADWLSESRVKASGLVPVSGSDLGLFAITGTTPSTVVILR